MINETKSPREYLLTLDVYRDAEGVITGSVVRVADQVPMTPDEALQLARDGLTAVGRAFN